MGMLFFLLSQDASECEVLITLEGGEYIRTLKLCLYIQASVKRNKKQFKCERSKNEDCEASSYTEGSSF